MKIRTAKTIVLLALSATVASSATGLFSVGRSSPEADLADSPQSTHAPTFAPTVAPIFEKGDWPWKVMVHSYHDRAITRKLGPAWLLNIGPTGLRAQITHEHLAYLTIRFVFEKSPAAGLIKAGDIVVGANGKMLTRPHRFGRGRSVRPGWDGPLMDMSKLIEDSQGKDGKLELIVWPGGSKSEQKKVTIQLKRVGRFSPTYPFDCPRSDKLMIDLCDFLVSEYKREGGFLKRVHTHSHCVLALMATGEKKYEPLIKKIMSGYKRKRYDSASGAGFPSWTWGYDGVVMGEYYLRSRDKGLIPAMASLANAYAEGQTWGNGGYSHRPFPFIMRRIAKGGPKGYGAMAAPGGLAMLAQSLFKAGGLEYSEECYQRIHQAYLASVSPNSPSFAYSFTPWQHAVLTLTDPKKSAAKSPKGIGYRCPTDMEGIGKYTIEWPTKKDPRYKDTSWVAAEAATNRVFDKGGATRLVVRTMNMPEPKQRYRTTKGNHQAPVGLGALAHLIGNEGNKSWQYMAEHCAMGCALDPESLLDGHASSSMHALWGPLAAARADAKTFRAYMDYLKWWFIMSETHDGGFFIFPARDRDTNTDPVYGPRNLPTANAALILALSRRQLQITGADPVSGSPNSPLASLQSGDFLILKCKKEADSLRKGRPYSPVLKALDRAARKDDAKGQEAVRFAVRLRAWISERAGDLFSKSKISPAATLLEMREFMKLARGLKESLELGAREKEVRAMSGLSPLLAHYKAYDRLQGTIRTKGSSRSTKAARASLKKKIDAFVLLDGLDPTLRIEAEALLLKIQM